MQFLLRRIGFYLIAAWASITLNFFLPRLMPGDPANVIFGRFQGRMRPEEIEAMRIAYGLSDESLIKQYFEYIGAIFRGDFGRSISAFPAPVSEIIRTSLSWTLLLGITALLISFTLGSLLGILGAWKRGGPIDSFVPPFFSFIGAFPYFFLAILALYFVGFQWGLLPLRHAYSDRLSPEWSLEFALNVGKHLIMPAGTIVLVSIGGWILAMRNTMIGTISEDYVTMAEAKGLSDRRVMFRYAARNALLPNITGFGMAFGFIVSGALLTEVVFSYPGLGNQLIIAVRNLDYPLMQGIFLMITFAVLLANLLVDILYVRLDPRVRY
ncbi:MAG: ABC transporter permease [Thermomicrobiales bacterium]|nr:ABC transporter permease [Thermomicrobiales bacterium]